MYEVTSELVEAREELDLLRLHMDVAEQEKQAAKHALASAQAALAAALAAPLEPAPQQPLQNEVWWHCFMHALDDHTWMSTLGDVAAHLSDKFLPAEWQWIRAYMGWSFAG